MAAPVVAHVQKMDQEAGHCALFYQGLGLDTLSAVAWKLQQFVEASVKRCKDKHLDEAAQLLGVPEQGLGTLSDDTLLPLIRCIITCQIGTCNSSSSFQKLEKIISKLSEIRQQLVSQELESSLAYLVQSEEILQIPDLQTVCMYLEGSSVGQEFFRQHLSSLLKRTSVTFSELLQDQTTQNVLYSNLTVKFCLQLFREATDKITPLVWTPVLSDHTLHSILESLLKIITTQNANRDTRLLAGTALTALANTSPVPEVGAQAVFNLVQRMTGGTDGDVSFGEQSLFIPLFSLDGLGVLAVIRGVLTCGHKDLLTCELLTSSQRLTLLEHLLPVVSSLCLTQTENYYSFQVLSLWLQRVREHITRILKIHGAWLLAGNGEMLRQLSQVLWAGAEMPVDGLSDLVLSCFQHFLHIHRRECLLIGSKEEPVLCEMLHRIAGASWQSRSKYNPLCALLPFLGPERVLAMYPQLPVHLFHCLYINYLCPPASETYRTLINLQREEWSQRGQKDEVKLAECWAVIWLSHLCNALSSTESSLQNNAATHLLPSTLRCFPESSTLLAAKLQGAGLPQIRGWISLVRGQKVIFGQVAGDVGERLRLCLESADDSVRLSALTYLCCGPRSSQPPSLQDIELLREYLPYNLGCDNPGFRQQLQAVLRKALEKMRDGALIALRKGQSDDKKLSQTIDFLQWLLQLSVSSLSPAGNYQRRCSGLLTLCTLLETCTDCWMPQRKKGQPPSDMSLLLHHARQEGCWDFFSAHITQALVGCMQDSTNEIREMASDLFVRFFPPAPESLTLTLFELGRISLCSPRVPVAEAGALIMKTLLQRCDGAILFPGDAPYTALSFVTCLVEMLQDQYCSATDNLLQAATIKPLHGVLCALRLCLLEIPSVSHSFSQVNLASSWRCLLQKLVSNLREIASFILSVLYGAQGAKPPEAPAPSFADMGKAVSVLIAQGRGLEEMQGAILLSEEHSLIMTCCWVSLKEIGVLLGPLVEKLISDPAAALFPLSAVKDSVATYQDIFLRCRHWGAVDGCSAGFTKLCSALIHHEDPQLRDLPRDLMEQALAQSRSQRSLSVTRRAAGFPVLLQCILCAEGPQHPLLETCVSSLLALAEETLPSDWDQTRDLPQVSAVHALQTMLRTAGLRSVLLKHAVPMMSLALRALRSCCWAMRNAALQLFSVLAGSMLGLSRSDSDSSVQSTVSVGALLRGFPGLQDLLLNELYDGLHKGQILHPSLHPPLTLLARLQPGGDSEASCFLEPLLDLAENPIYAVRVMAASALVPIVQMTEYDKILLRLVELLPHANERVSHNVLHGRLLQLKALLLTGLREKCMPVDIEQELAKRLHLRLWLLSKESCPLVRAAFLQVLSLLVSSRGMVCASQVLKTVCEKLNAEEKEQGVQVGSAVFHEACIVYFCNEAASSSDPALHTHLCCLLKVCDPAMLKWLNERKDISPALGVALRRTLQDMLCSVLLSKDSSEKQKRFLEVYIHVHKIDPALSNLSPPQSDIKGTEMLLQLLESSQGGPQLRGLAQCTVSLLLAHSPMLEDIPLASRWLSALCTCADPALSCEELRLAAAQALQIAGAYLVRGAVRQSTPGLRELAVRAVVCGVDLLQDEDRGVREAAAYFAVGSMDLPAEVTLQNDQALLRLLQLLRNKFWDCTETFHALLFRLPPYDLHAALCSLQDRSVSLYEQDDPNVFADSMFLSSLLLPVICAVLGSLCSTPSLRSPVLQWITCTASVIRKQIQFCHIWRQEQGSVSPLWLKASGCPHVNAAVLGLFVRGELLASTLQNLSSVGDEILDFDLNPCFLREELSELKGELLLHGLGPSTIQFSL
ncbi:tRNA (32-2'-O)-methyltransferase regulator THADA-like [Discoglossus pictus]